jgi:AcrR family transcriptional regulator
MFNNGAVGDRRTRRTLRALTESSLEILRNEGWDGMTVSRLCEAAGIGRSTFYLHFRTPSEAVSWALRSRYLEEFPEIITDASALEPETLLARGKPLSYPIFAHIARYRDIYERIFTDDRGSGVLRRLQGDAEEISRAQHESLRRISPTPPEAGLTAAYIGGALIFSARWWITSGSESSPLEMAYWFSRMAAPGLLEIMGLSHIVNEE